MNMDLMNQSQNNPFMQFGEPSQPSAPSMPSMPSMPGMPSRIQTPPSLQPQIPVRPTPTTPGGSTVNLPDQAALVREGPPPISNVGYIPGFLATNIGKVCRAEFILGSNQYVDKTGRLMAVGINYFVLQDLVSGAMVMCDLYSVRFVTML